MSQLFKRQIVNFSLLHLTFAVLLLTGYKLFTDLTIEIFSYLFWFIVIFGLLATLAQSAIFSVLSFKVRLNKLLFFIIAFTVELVLVNAFVVYANGGGDSFTGNLINDIIYRNTWENLSGTLIMHIAVFLSTLIISLTRPFYKQVAV